MDTDPAKNGWWPLTLGPCNFADIDRFLTKFVPIDSPDWDLSIGTRFSGVLTEHGERMVLK